MISFKRPKKRNTPSRSRTREIFSSNKSSRLRVDIRNSSYRHTPYRRSKKTKVRLSKRGFVSIIVIVLMIWGLYSLISDNAFNFWRAGSGDMTAELNIPQKVLKNFLELNEKKELSKKDASEALKIYAEHYHSLADELKNLPNEPKELEEQKEKILDYIADANFQAAEKILKNIQTFLNARPQDKASVDGFIRSLKANGDLLALTGDPYKGAEFFFQAAKRMKKTARLTVVDKEISFGLDKAICISKGIRALTEGDAPGEAISRGEKALIEIRAERQPGAIGEKAIILALADARLKQNLPEKALEIIYRFINSSPLQSEVDDEVAASLIKNATALHQKGRDIEAVKAFSTALGIFERSKGQILPEYISALCLKAEALNDLGEQSEALKFVEKALKISESDPNLNELINIRVRLVKAEILSSGNKPENKHESAQIFEELNEKMKKRSLNKSVEYAAVLCGMGRIAREKGMAEKSIPAFEKARDIILKTNGRNSTEFVDVQAELAKSFISIGHSTEAKEILGEIEELSRKTRGWQHPDHARILELQSRANRELGKITLALNLLEMAEKIYLSSIGPDNIKYAEILLEMALLHEQLNEKLEARNLQERALGILEAKMGLSHPLTRQLRSKLE